jgi:hypothetical protein
VGVAVSSFDHNDEDVNDSILEARRALPTRASVELDSMHRVLPLNLQLDLEPLKDGGLFFARASGLSGVGIDSSFRFAEYLTFCYAEMLVELIEFKSSAWLLVLVLRLFELICLLGGVGASSLELAFGVFTVSVQVAMWVVGRMYANDVISAAQLGFKPDALRQSKRKSVGRLAFASATDPSDTLRFKASRFVRITRQFHVDEYFLLTLQAFAWRNVFRVVEWLLGPQLRDAGSGGLQSSLGARVSLGVVITMALSSLLLPAILYDWGLAMFLPPHIDERNVEVAELVRAQARALRGPRAEGRGGLAPGAPSDAPMHPLWPTPC